MKIFLRILKFIEPYKARMVLAVFFMMIVSACLASSMYLLKPLLDNGLVNANPDKAFKTIVTIALSLIGIYFIKGLSFYCQDYLLNNVGQKIIMDIRNKVYGHMQQLSLKYYSSNRTGDMLSRIGVDVVNMQSAVGSLSSILSNSFTFLGLLFVVLNMNWKLTMLVFLVCPFIVYPVYNFGKRLRIISASTQAKIGDITSVAHEGVSNIRIVKAFNMEEHELDKFKQANRSFFDTYMKAVRITAMSQPIVEIISIIATAGIIIYGGHQIISKQVTVGAFASFTGALFLLFNPIKNLNGVNVVIQTALSSAERIFELLDAPLDVTDSSAAVDMPVFSKTISFVNVNFGYRKEKIVLKNINLDINKGQIVAIVGPSGAGKSTLVDLIPRFYDVDSGELKVDGVSIRDFRIKSLRAEIGIVTQETILFNDTIKENILYGRPGASLEEVYQAAKAANAHDFILKTQDGYDTLIGERGVKLSGGERQRLSIARAILKNPPILILDEATSALDTESEKLVQDALNTLMKNRTTVVIAHRLSTVINADLIVVMEEGKIAGIGKHNELLENNPLYKKLYEMQFTPKEG